MSIIDDLRPTKKLRVMDLLKDAGADISDWANYKGKSPSSNPRYCYNWSFEQPGEFVVACLWHKRFLLKGNVSYVVDPNARGVPRNRRAATTFDEHMRMAYTQRLPVKVIVVTGRQRNPSDPNSDTSVVTARRLDLAAWAIKEYDYKNGKCRLVRGEKPLSPIIESSDLVLSWFEGVRKLSFIYHRRRESQARRAKIDEAMRLNSGKLICEVPNCGFDFVERYGSLGKGYAQVHHRDPLRKAPKKGRTVRLTDLAIVCANCHVMIHKGGGALPLEGLIAASRA